MTNEEAKRKVRGYLTDILPSDCSDEIDEIINALEQTRWIPKNATNGDMIISLYPNLKYYVKGDRMMTTIGVASSFDLEWWNAPYREEDAE